MMPREREVLEMKVSNQLTVRTQSSVEEPIREGKGNEADRSEPRRPEPVRRYLGNDSTPDLECVKNPPRCQPNGLPTPEMFEPGQGRHSFCRTSGVWAVSPNSKHTVYKSLCQHEPPWDCSTHGAGTTQQGTQELLWRINA